MKLRVRVNKQTSRVELLGEEPSVKELKDLIKETVLSSYGLSADTEFSLSLNGSELLSGTDQTLSSCGVVSGDLICVILPKTAVDAAATSTSSSSTSSNQATTSSGSVMDHSQQKAAMTSKQPCSSRSAAVTKSEESGPMLDPGPSVPKWEPMLCNEAEQGQAPLSLELLYHSARVTSPSDAIIVAGNVLMLETGFIPQGHEQKPSEMPAGWRSAGGVYRLPYTHPLCENSQAMVVAVCMGPVLVINATLKANKMVDTACKLCLSPSSYVTDEWPGESAAAAFKDLRKLSRIFKDQLAYPLIAAAREAMDLPVAFGLGALPPELLFRVLRLLDVRSVVRLSSASRHFNIATADSTLWRHLYQRDFTYPESIRSRDTDWKERYKRSYKTRNELRLVQPYHPDILRRQDPMRLPLPYFPPVPGIIGGEYDQRPNLPYGTPIPLRYDPIGPPPIDRRPRTTNQRRGFI